MKKLVTALVGLALFAGVAMAKENAVVILNGRVMDPETSFDGIRNVGVKDGKIYKNTL